MWIVILGDNTRHSAWDSKQEAIKQVKVLQDYGYIKPTKESPIKSFIEYDKTVDCENGHYYV